MKSWIKLQKLNNWPKCFLALKEEKQIRRIVVPHAATHLTLKKVEGQGHSMVPIERACHKDHACQIQCSTINT